MTHDKLRLILNYLNDDEDLSNRQRATAEKLWLECDKEQQTNILNFNIDLLNTKDN